MGLFRTKRVDENEADRCPRCRERLPDGATACMMCGVALEPLRGGLRNEEAKASGGLAATDAGTGPTESSGRETRRAPC
jgi:hypothetical protein